MQIEALIERLEGLSVPDREVDFDIYEAATIILAKEYPEAVLHDDAGTLVAIRHDGWPWVPTEDSPEPGSWHSICFAPQFTASLDAAIALVGKVLPGKPVLIGWAQTSDTLPWARVGAWSEHDATAASPAIALCLAMFRALAAGGSDA